MSTAVLAMIDDERQERPGCPSWCDEDVTTSAAEVLHCADLPDAWGTTDERLRLGLQRQDDEDGEGETRLSVQYLPNGRTVLGTVELEMSDAPAFILEVVRLMAADRGETVAAILAEITGLNRQHLA